jgi:hypothetical protein
MGIAKALPASTAAPAASTQSAREMGKVQAGGSMELEQSCSPVAVAQARVIHGLRIPTRKRERKRKEIGTFKIYK